MTIPPTLERVVDDERGTSCQYDPRGHFSAYPKACEAYSHNKDAGIAQKLSAACRVYHEEMLSNFQKYVVGLYCEPLEGPEKLIIEMFIDWQQRAAQAKPDMEAVARAIFESREYVERDWNYMKERYIGAGKKQNCWMGVYSECVASAKAAIAALGKPQASDAEIDRLSMEANMGRQAEADANVELAEAVEMVKALRKAGYGVLEVSGGTEAHGKLYDSLSAADQWLKGEAA